MGTFVVTTLKKAILLVAVWWCIQPCIAHGELPGAVEDALPSEARDIIGKMDEPSSLREGMEHLWEMVTDLLPGIGRSGLKSAVAILCVVAVCTVAGSVEIDQSPQLQKCVAAAGIVAITMLSTREMTSIMALGQQLTEELDVFSKALLPSLAAAVAAGGGIISAGVRQAATVFFANLLIGLVRDFLLPLAYYYIAAVAMGALLPEQNLNSLALGMKKAISWILTGSLLLFVGYLSISGAAATSADALTLQLTKSAISTAVPVVGGIISDAAGSVLYSAGLLKNTLGVVGMLAVLASCLTPFLTMAVQYLLYKATGFLASLFGVSQVCNYIADLGGAFGLVLGMTGSCALLLLISIASCVSVVVT